MRIPAALFLVVLALSLAAPVQETPKQAPPTQRRSLVPDTFANLTVLPKDIAKADLTRIMRQFSFTTDQRCNYCHVATDDLSQADFASDDKEPKRKARELMKFILETRNQTKAGS